MDTALSQEIRTSCEAKSKAVSDLNLKALLVEDFEMMRKAASDVLHSLNIKVVEAHNGVEALKILDSEPVDVVFSDLVMPEMDGFELWWHVLNKRTMDG